MINKYVVAKSKGPKYLDYHIDSLTIGKRYEIIEICGILKRYKGIIDGSFNPKEPQFYIKVIDDRGKIHNIWNDYFYSTEELRNIKLKCLFKSETRNI